MRIFLLTLLWVSLATAVSPVLQRDTSSVEGIARKPRSIFSWVKNLFSKQSSDVQATSPVSTNPATTDTAGILAEPAPLVICSWNIFRFGPGKLSVPDPLIVAGKNITRLGIILDVSQYTTGGILQYRSFTPYHSVWKVKNCSFESGATAELFLQTSVLRPV